MVGLTKNISFPYNKVRKTQEMGEIVMTEARVYTVQEIATILKVSEKTAYKIIHAGELEVIWVRGQIRITSHALETFLQGGRNGQEGKKRVCV